MMGRYDDISAEQLRSDLVRFAEVILRLDRDDQILVSPADLQRILGELRQKLFAYEIRSSRLNLPPSSESPADTDLAERERDPVVRKSLKVVREAVRRAEDMLQEWEEPSEAPEGDD